MGGLTSRNKGKRGEREVVKLSQPIVDNAYTSAGLEPPILERNLMQSHRGGYDIVGLEFLALEVKFQEQITINAWWRQTTEQAGQNRVPVLIYRKSRVAWRVVMYGTLAAGVDKLRVPVDISLEDFLVWFDARLSYELSRG